MMRGCIGAFGRFGFAARNATKVGKDGALQRVGPAENEPQRQWGVAPRCAGYFSNADVMAERS